MIQAKLNYLSPDQIATSWYTFLSIEMDTISGERLVESGRPVF